MKLIIGNKTVSSWSLRPWLLMRHFSLPFEEILIKLDMPETTDQILKYSPSGRVPALVDGDLVIWESLAIMEYLNEQFPQKKMYPRDIKERAYARSMANEMHAGFTSLREYMSFHSRRMFPEFDWSPAVNDIRRINALWTEALQKSGGPFLCGEFGLVDAMYAPVVCRFKTYGIPVAGAVAEYCKTVQALPAMRQWYEEAAREDFVAEKHEAEFDF